MTQAELIAQAKRDYEAARLANNRAGMDAAHKAADTARGYTTDPTGTTRISSYQEALQQARKPSQVASTPQTFTQQQKPLSVTGGGGNIYSTPAPLLPITPVYDFNAQQDYAKQLADAQRKKALSSLEQAYQKNVSGLQAEQEAVNPLFAGQTRQAVAQATMGKKSFSDFLAEKGLSGSGLAGQGELSQNIAMQSQLGGIEADRTGALADIERRRTGLGQDLAYGQQQAEAGIDIQLLENQMRQQEIDRDRAYKEQQQSIGLQSDREADVKNQFLDTITRFANDYQAQINKIRGDADPSNDWQIPYLETARQDKLGNIAKGQSEQQNALYKMAMDKWESGVPVNAQEANALGVRVGSVKPVKSSGGGGSTATKPISNDFAVDGIEAIMKRYEPAKGIAGALQKAFPSGAMQKEIQNYFQQLADSGYPERELRLLAARYGIQFGSTSVQDSSTRMTN